MRRPNFTLLLTCNGHFGDQNLGSLSGNCQEDTERGQSQDPTPAGLPQASGCRMGCLTFDLEQAFPQPSISHVADSDPLPLIYAIVQCRILPVFPGVSYSAWPEICSYEMFLSSINQADQCLRIFTLANSLTQL